ncbi:MAG: ABC transporter permease subunit [Chloroflexi bacterium]|nr:ABC transporter permease subunit [Chloroflexota bacterium]
MKATEPGRRDIWGWASGHILSPTQRIRWADILLLIGIAGVLFGILGFAHEATTSYHAEVRIDLSLSALPRYAFFSLCRGLAAFALAIAFTLVYGYWAAKDRAAEWVLVPLLDILQSVPVLAFMPGVVISLTSLFPSSNVGLEVASILMIFTGQVWNMTFSFYHSLRSIPDGLAEVSRVYRFNWWQRFRWVELPFSMIGIVWNGMMGMAGGWFFLMVSEAFVLGNRDFRLAGIGSYMSVAVNQGNVPAMIGAVLTMIVMIVALDQLFWRPVVVWTQRFRIEESASEEITTSWFWNLVEHSRLRRWISGALEWMKRLAPRHRAVVRAPVVQRRRSLPLRRVVLATVLATLIMVLGVGAWKLADIIVRVPAAQWGRILGAGGVTLLRVFASTALGTLWALPAGLAIGLSPRLSRLFQPVVQVLASFPAPMLFPLVIAALTAAGIPLGPGSIVLMLLGTQWYILFNVIAGATAIPSDLKEAADAYNIRGWRRFRTLYLPVVFPYLVTGWVTAAGGAWNASIVSEYVTYKGTTLTAWGLGSTITKAAAAADFPLLAASVVTMAVIVVLVNRLVWRRFYKIADDRFSLSR